MAGNQPQWDPELEKAKQREINLKLNQLNQGKRLTGSRSAPFTFTSA